MNRMVPLIIGVDGLIGNGLWNLFHPIYPGTLGTSRRGTLGLPFLDLTRPCLDSLDLSQITHAIIAGGDPNIRSCELDPEATSLCNLKGTLKLAHGLSERGIRPVLFSTDYVFNGEKGGYTEEDQVCPINQYGLQKAELEKHIYDATSGNYLMLRLTKVIPNSKIGSGLIGEVAKAIGDGKKIRAATDLVFTPVLLDDVVDGIHALMIQNVRGLYNLGGNETWTRYDLCKEIERYVHRGKSMIEPIILDDLKEPFRRPKKTDLVMDKFEKTTGLKRKPVTYALSTLFG